MGRTNGKETNMAAKGRIAREEAAGTGATGMTGALVDMRQVPEVLELIAQAIKLQSVQGRRRGETSRPVRVKRGERAEPRGMVNVLRTKRRSA